MEQVPQPAPEPIPEESIKIKPATSRVVIVDTISFQSADLPCSSVESRFAITCKEEEQPVHRVIKVGPEWTPLPSLWLKHGSQLFLRNDEGQNLSKIPTPEEKAASERRIIRLGVNSGFNLAPFAVIRPGRSIRIEPHDLATLYVCGDFSDKEPIKATLFIVPE